MYKNAKLGTKIGFGFGIAVAVLSITVLVTMWQVGRTNEITTRAIDLRAPTLQTSLTLQTGMHHSLAALRGWIILGAEKFKVQRQQAWDEEIDASVTEMKRLSVNWTNAENKQRLDTIESKLKVFKIYQSEIEAIANTPENLPANRVLFEEAAPLAKVMVTTITKLIDLEAKLPATVKRKALLGMMADVRGTTGLGLANIRAYLLGGDPKFKRGFENVWLKNTRRFRDLSSNVGLLSLEQKVAFEAFGNARAKFVPLPEKMFEIRGGQSWNLANLWLGTKAAPVAAEIVKEISATLESQRALMQADSVAAQSGVSQLNGIMWALLLVGIGLCSLFGYLITRAITRPVAKLVVAAQEFAAGDLNQEIEYHSDDEIGKLSEAFRGILDAQKEMGGTLDAIAQGNLEESVRVRGERDSVGKSMVEMRASIRRLAEDMGCLVHAAVAGDLDERADVGRHKGDYQKVIQGVNETLDAMVTPIQEASLCLEKLAGYDLRVRMQGSYKGQHAKIKDALNATAQALHDSLAQVADASEQVSSASSQIASSSQSVAQGASQQASSLEQTSSSLEEMSGMTKQNADNTQRARVLAEVTRDAAERGAGAMTEMNDAMEKIHTSAEGTAQIIGDITEIAFQTNLLALNAAVEAARAGDAGRGFAVVAEEVRNLALRSKEAAGKTEALIRESVSLAKQGGEMSKNVSNNLNEIVDSIGKVTEIVSEIALASDEQARGVDQVNCAVSEMDKVVQQAAASSEQSSSAAEELAGQSQELASMVGRFELSRTYNRGTTPVTLTASNVNAHRVVELGSRSLRPSNGRPSRKLSRVQSFPLNDEEELANF